MAAFAMALFSEAHRTNRASARVWPVSSGRVRGRGALWASGYAYTYSLL